MTNRIHSLVILCLILVSCCSALAATALLLLDADNTYKSPRNYRIITSQTQGAFSSLGFEKIHLMGSAQFSQANLNYVLAHYPHPDYIFDLRQESHGFINDGIAFSWYEKYNWANKYRSDEKNLKLETKLLQDLAQHTQTTLQMSLRKEEGTIVDTSPINVQTRQALSEQQLADSKGIKYVRILVPDHDYPSDQQIETFVQLIRSIPNDKWLYFHCKAGKGRTTMFMSMVDMMHNSKLVSFDDIIKRQFLAGGQNLAPGKKAISLFEQLAVNRYRLLQNFYYYCRSNQDNYATTWTTWKKQQARTNSSC